MTREKYVSTRLVPGNSIMQEVAAEAAAAGRLCERTFFHVVTCGGRLGVESGLGCHQRKNEQQTGRGCSYI